MTSSSAKLPISKTCFKVSNRGLTLDDLLEECRYRWWTSIIYRNLNFKEKQVPSYQYVHGLTIENCVITTEFCSNSSKLLLCGAKTVSLIYPFLDLFAKWNNVLFIAPTAEVQELTIQFKHQGRKEHEAGDMNLERASVKSFIPHA